MEDLSCRIIGFQRLHCRSVQASCCNEAVDTMKRTRGSLKVQYPVDERE